MEPLAYTGPSLDKLEHQRQAMNLIYAAADMLVLAEYPEYKDELLRFAKKVELQMTVDDENANSGCN